MVAQCSIPVAEKWPAAKPKAERKPTAGAATEVSYSVSKWNKYACHMERLGTGYHRMDACSYSKFP